MKIPYAEMVEKLKQNRKEYNELTEQLDGYVRNEIKAKGLPVFDVYVNRIMERLTSDQGISYLDSSYINFVASVGGMYEYLYNSNPLPSN